MAEPTTRRTQGARTGGRSQRVVRAVLGATMDEIARAGYGRLRVEDVAARAGVNKTTVYRRWPTKAALVSTAIRAAAGHGEPLPDTGSARTDLVELMRRVVGVAATPEGRAIVRLLTLESDDPEVDRIARDLREEGRTLRMHVMERAKERGELPADIDTRLVLDAIVTPVITRVLGYGELVDDGTVVRLVDLVLTGVAHGAGRQPAS